MARVNKGPMIHQTWTFPNATEQWQREANERAEEARMSDRAKHPALWDKLCEIDTKLDRVIKMLEK